jgi:translation initiation factor 1A
MTKNSGGKGHRKSKNQNGGSFRREIIFKDFSQDYALITKMLGNGHCECKCYSDDVSRLGNIRGKMRKRVWLSVGDVVLCGLREYQDEKVDIIHKYTIDEVHNLKTMGEIPFDEKDQENDEAILAGEEEEIINVELI